MKELQPADFRRDDSSPFSPTAVFYIRKHEPPSSTLSVHDVTENSSPVPSLDEATAKTVEHSPVFEIRQKSAFSRTFYCLDSAGAHMAEITGPLLSFGHWKLTFPDEPPRSSHAIEVRPVSVGSQADVFVQDSVPYFWEVQDATRRLFKVMDNARVEVARFISKRSRDMSGMLAIDNRQVDAVVAMMTSVAVLKRSDSFRK